MLNLADVDGMICPLGAFPLVCPDPSNSPGNVEGNRLPSMDGRKDPRKPLDHNAIACDRQDSCRGVASDNGSGCVVDFGHLDSLMTNARTIERGCNEFESFRGVNDFSRAIHGVTSESHHVIHLYDPQAQPMYFKG